MRIIAGQFRHRRLASPPQGANTRPLTDRAKESVFSQLAGNIENARVLDAFAGTGTFGLEALSRGAGECVFVEKDRKVASVLEQNIRTLGCEDRARVIRADALGAALLVRAPEQIDLAFFDPPYAMAEDRGGWERITTQFARVVAMLSGDGYALLRTPWPFRHPTGGQLGGERDAGLDVFEDDDDDDGFAGDIEIVTKVPRVDADLTIDGAAGPETHIYAGTAVHMYMKR